jgi:translin
MKEQTTKKLRDICDRIRSSFDAKDAAREQALPLAREIIRNSADAIRAVHRQQNDQASELLEKTAALVRKMRECLAEYPDVYFAGFLQDAQKEYAEAIVTVALIGGQEVPAPEEIGVDYVAYLGGLAEAVGEMRRHILDRLRLEGGGSWGEQIIGLMDEIYYQLVSFDYPQAISGGLKRSTDMMRGVLEKTRGDLTMAIQQEQLQKALRELERKLAEGDVP